MEPNRIRALRDRLGWTQEQLAEAAGTSNKQISKLEKSQRKLTVEWMMKLAPALRCRAVDLLPDEDRPEMQRIEVLGAVQAGHWREAVEWPVGDRYTLDVPRAGRYQKAPRYGLVVRGRSMDMVYPVGTVLIVVSAIEVGYVPANHDRVIVERRGPDGLTEATVKEFVVSGDELWLWPRSTHPDFQQPIRLPGPGGGAEFSDDDEVKITGLVVGSYRPE